jgi:hypothetical protein
VILMSAAGAIYWLFGVQRHAADNITRTSTGAGADITRGTVVSSIVPAYSEPVLFFACIISILATFFAVRYDKLMWGLGAIVMTWLIAGAMLGWGS